MTTLADESYRLRASEDPAHCDRAAHDQAPRSIWLEVVDRFPDLRIIDGAQQDRTGRGLAPAQAGFATLLSGSEWR